MSVQKGLARVKDTTMTKNQARKLYNIIHFRNNFIYDGFMKIVSFWRAQPCTKN